MSRKTPILALKPRKSDGCDGFGQIFDKYPSDFPYAESIKKPVTPVTPVTFLNSGGENSKRPQEVASPQIDPGVAALELEEARLRFDRLEAAKGVAGACRAVWRVSRWLEREQSGFWRRLNASDRHALTVCVALLETSLSPEGATA